MNDLSVDQQFNNCTIFTMAAVCHIEFGSTLIYTILALWT